MRPLYSLKTGSTDIDAEIQRCFVSLDIEDESGRTSDSLTLVLCDADGTAPFLAKGTELRAAVGGSDRLLDKGVFVVDEVEVSGPPDQLIYKAAGADFRSSLKEPVDRSWDGVLIGDMVESIAVRHGLKPKVADALASIAVSHWDQTSESDLHTLTRLAGQHEAIAKPVNGYLVFVPRGESKSASGKNLGKVVIDRSMCSRYRFTLPDRKKYQAVEAKWQDLASGEEKTATVGGGKPIDRIRHQYSNEEEATSAARAKLKAHMYGKAEFFAAMPGIVDVVAESPIVATGFRSGLPENWVAERVRYSVSGQGASCSVTAKRKADK